MDRGVGFKIGSEQIVDMTLDPLPKRILMVLTSNATHTDGQLTGLWEEEFTNPYYAFLAAGFVVSLASPQGGQPPIDPMSAAEDTVSNLRFDDDYKTQALLTSTALLSSVSAKDYDAVFYSGGHGASYDFADNADSIALIESFLMAGKPVAATCHGVAALLNAKDPAGEYAIKGRNVTGFSNSEEGDTGLVDVLPMLVETQMTVRGAIYQSVANWNPLAVEDGLLITGQNSQSSTLIAAKVVAAVSA